MLPNSRATQNGGEFVNIIDQTLQQIISGNYEGQNQHFWSVLLKEVIKELFRQNLVRQ